MKIQINALLNIKPTEARLVKQLFFVQFFLGVATSFLLTGALTLFLTTYPVKELPWVFLLTAALLFLANSIYARLEAKLSAKKLLQVVILFSLGSILFTWIEATFFRFTWLPFFVSAWNMVVYMVVGYAFWGMAAIIFNVRESKRIFSVVGSGDIPAKIIGYSAVAALAPLIGIINVFGIALIAFGIGYYFLSKLQHPIINNTPDHSHHGHSATHEHTSLVSRFFHNNLILVIAIWSFLGFTIYSLLDYTFLTEVKAKYSSSQELASFLGIFFAGGRVIAMFLKLLFSSRVINRLGLTNALLITPAVLLIITSFILITGTDENAILITFGIMVLFSEILKSTVQDPSFFVLFQPLDPHARLKGHLITKGYTMPFSLLAVSLFAFTFRDASGEISIPLVCGTMLILLLIWAAAVFFIKKEYVHTLIRTLQKGYFTGTQLFLNNQAVKDLLLDKTNSDKPKEVLFALELLERSGYLKLEEVLLKQLNSPFTQVKKFVLSQVVRLNISAALPIIQKHLSHSFNPGLKPDLIRVLYYLNPNQAGNLSEIRNFDPATKKAALLGLAAQAQIPALNLVEQEIAFLATSKQEEDKELALDIISEAPQGNFYTSLQVLLRASKPGIYKKAIEAVGRVREFRLWSEMLAVTQKHQAWAAFQKAILHFGDPIFTSEYTSVSTLPDSVLSHLIIAAVKTEGKYSNAFLLEFLSPGGIYKDAASAALYHKKAHLTGS
ncbi:MAG: NTP/NDP exchange transporter, partial [Bacteroidota bacterium]|nr:NTP/NDP exchange transporter [Bacteroidota bacterium]